MTHPDPKADPHCPHCHGTGLMTLNTPFLDRVEEESVTCRCVKARADQTSAPLPDSATPNQKT